MAKQHIGKWILAAWLAAPMSAIGACPTPVSFTDPGSSITTLVPGSEGHGLHGLAVGLDGKLYIGSVFGQTIYKVDPVSGATSPFVLPPAGEADDLVFVPDGTTEGMMLWTAPIQGKVFKRTTNECTGSCICPNSAGIVELASGLPGANSLAVAPDGKLYVTQVVRADALWQVDICTGAKVRLRSDLGDLNGFDFGPDGKLYGPTGTSVVKIDVQGSGTYEPIVVADGYRSLGAVNFDPTNGALYAVATRHGQVLRVDLQRGVLTPIATLESALDNLAFTPAPDGRLFVSNMTRNRVYQVDPATGKSRIVVSGTLTLPSTLAYTRDVDGDWLYLADLFALRRINPVTGEVQDILRRFANSKKYATSTTVNDKHVVMSSWLEGTVQLLERGGNTVIETLTGFDLPYDAIEFADGTIVVAEFGAGRLIRVSPPDDSGARTRNRVGRPFGGVLFSGTFDGPVALAQAGLRAVYVSEAAAGRVSRVDIDSGLRIAIASGLSQPEGLAVTPDGRLLVVEAGNRRLLSIRPVMSTPREVCTLATDLPIGLPPWPGGPAPYMVSGVTVAPDGHIFLTSDVLNAILKF